jgi:DNA-binding SARP family transcriptional activator/tetratricopeptide (TPR) repeat protein
MLPLVAARLPVVSEGHVRFQLLGPVQGRVGDRPISLGARKQRFVFTVLALEINTLVPVSRLVDLIWPDTPPASARGMIHTYVSGLRAILAEHQADRRRIALVSGSAGYELRCDPTLVDAHRFRELVAHAGTECDWERRVVLLEEALGLWHGPALAGVAPEPVRVRLCRHLDEARLAATEERAEALLRLGRLSGLVDELMVLVEHHPHRQRLTGQLMLALHQGGRTAEALGVYDRARRELADELGLDPGDDLKRLHQAILRGESEPGTVESALPAQAALLRPAQLPADLAIFTGRTAELNHLLALWPAGSAAGPATVVVSAIEGMAGIGKTTLAVHAAHRLVPRFPDGQIFVDLHGFTPGAAPVPPSEALDRMLRALGVPGPTIPPGLDDRAAMFRTALADKRVLILLDNAADEPQVDPLLPGAPGCLVLVTSRQRLTGLDNAHPVSLDVLSTDDALTLFARASGADEGTDVLGEIVELCGRLPLAIRIAAVRMRARPHWTAAHLAEKLRDHQHRLAELDTGQRSVIAALDLSYRNLSTSQQRLYRLLGLHPGPDIDTHAAAALTSSTPRQAGRLLDSLVDSHLLAEPTPGRYRLHDLIRAHAAGVADTDESEPNRRAALTRMFDHYLRVAAAAMDTLYPAEQLRRPRVDAPIVTASSVSDPARAGAWLDAERPNLLATAAHASDHGWPAYANQLSQIVERHLQVRAYGGDAFALHTHALNACLRANDWTGQANALRGLGMVYLRWGQYDLALDRHERAVDLHSATGDRMGQARDHYGLGMARMQLGDLEQALGHHLQALDLYREIGDRYGEADVILGSGIVNAQLGRWERALDHFQQALDLYHQTGARAGVAHALANIGRIYGRSGQDDQAIENYQQALTLYRQIGDRVGEARTLGNLGAAYQRVGQYDQALDHHQQALTLEREIWDQHGHTTTLNDIGETLRAANRAAEALIAHQEALTMADTSGERYEQARAHDGLAHAHHGLGNLDQARRHWRQALNIFTDLGTPEAEQIRSRLQ